jgi:hypothetical protein
MIAEVRDVFEEDGGQVESDVVEEHEVLVELAHVADVRDDVSATRLMIENAAEYGDRRRKLAL